jgi:hypothetical protein
MPLKTIMMIIIVMTLLKSIHILLPIVNNRWIYQTNFIYITLHVQDSDLLGVRKYHGPTKCYTDDFG